MSVRGNFKDNLGTLFDASLWIFLQSFFRSAGLTSQEIYSHKIGDLLV